MLQRENALRTTRSTRFAAEVEIDDHPTRTFTIGFNDRLA
jgi:hypothetical protein